MNALNRENLPFTGFEGFGSHGQVFGHLDRVIPRRPSAGVVIEFESESIHFPPCLFAVNSA
jgi:hypothetical protein